MSWIEGFFSSLMRTVSVMIYQGVENVQGWHGISDQTNALPFRPTADEREQIRVGLLGDTNPFLSLALHFGSFSFSSIVHNGVLGGDRVPIQSLYITAGSLGTLILDFVGVVFTVFGGTPSQLETVLI